MRASLSRVLSAAIAGRLPLEYDRLKQRTGRFFGFVLSSPPISVTCLSILTFFLYNRLWRRGQYSPFVDQFS